MYTILDYFIFSLACLSFFCSVHCTADQKDKFVYEWTILAYILESEIALLTHINKEFTMTWLRRYADASSW